jgi:RNA polymerase sigma factor (sigma-70 family)
MSASVLPLRVKCNEKSMSDYLDNPEGDVQLWQAFKAGGPEAFERLYQRYVKALYNYGYNLSRDATLVEDAIQDLFVYLYDHRATLGDTNNIQFYLFRSLRRALAKAAARKDVLEADGYQFDSALFLSADIATQMAEEETAQLQQKKVMQHIDSLPKRQREAIFLLYIKGFTYPEVANTMDLEVKSVYNLINKAIHTLRHDLQYLGLLLSAALGLMWYLLQ